MVVDFAHLPPVVPQETLDRYYRWLGAASQTREDSESYLFDRARVRFEVHDGDRLVAAPRLKLCRNNGALAISGASGFCPLQEVEQLGASPQLVEQLLGRFDGNQTLGELRRLAPNPRAIDALVRDTFGKVLFAPLEVARLQQAVSATEVTRFPGSPYEIERNYWQNSGDVRASLDRFLSCLDDTAAFVEGLRQRHALLLLGKCKTNWYRPASRTGGQCHAPGQLDSLPAIHREAGETTIVVSGLRVSAPAVGGAQYHRRLYASLADPGASSPRNHQSTDGLLWGRCIWGRSLTETQSRPWFCPPRPMRSSHFDQLRKDLCAALAPCPSQSQDSRLAALAHFHQHFVQLHPFPCGNQSLAMSATNHILTQLMGQGIPHLILDQLALRLSPDAYAQVFRRAVQCYVRPELELSQKHLQLAEDRATTFSVSRRLEDCTSQREVDDLLRDASPRTRQLLLLEPQSA